MCKQRCAQGRCWPNEQRGRGNIEEMEGGRKNVTVRQKRRKEGKAWLQQRKRRKKTHNGAAGSLEEDARSCTELFQRAVEPNSLLISSSSNVLIFKPNPLVNWITIAT